VATITVYHGFEKDREHTFVSFGRHRLTKTRRHRVRKEKGLCRNAGRDEKGYNNLS